MIFGLSGVRLFLYLSLGINGGGSSFPYRVQPLHSLVVTQP